MSADADTNHSENVIVKDGDSEGTSDLEKREQEDGQDISVAIWIIWQGRRRCHNTLGRNWDCGAGRGRGGGGRW